MTPLMTFGRNPITSIAFEFHVMSSLEELRFDKAGMKSPSMEIWELGLQRAFEFMRKFVNFRQDPRVDFSGWGLLEIPAETFEKSLVGRITKLNFNGTPSALEATQGLILSQSPTDATSSR